MSKSGLSNGNDGRKLRKPRGAASLLGGLALFSALGVLNNMATSLQAQTGTPSTPKTNIVLVPGAHEDGMIWLKVIPALQAKGFNVTVVPIPLTSIAADATATRDILSRQQGPTILVGHSWGGMALTEAGNMSNVVGLVYIAALAPDAGETVLDTFRHFPLHTTARGYTDDKGVKWYWYTPEDFIHDWVPDLNAAEAQLLAADQRPIAATANNDKVTQAAWRVKPTWFLVSTRDRVESADNQRFLAKRMGATTVEIDADHGSPYTHPEDVVKIIVDAAQKAPTMKANPAH